MTNKKFSGLGTALITPFNETGDIDYDILTFLVRQQLKGGVDFLVPCGTTGESPTLSHREHLEVIEHTFYVTDNAVPILAGTGSNSTHEAVRLTREAKKLGADGSLAVAPYYNKPEPAGHRHYYESIAEVGLPVILYDIPGRTGRGVPTELIVDLANEGVIKGVKWASGDHNQLVDIINNTPEDFTVLSGDDAYTYGLLALGGNGAISVLSNLLPQEMSSMVQFGRDLSFSNALDLHNRYLPLMRAMFIETNPIPIKTAFHLSYSNNGKVNVPEKPVFRSPMSQMSSSNLVKLKKVLNEYEEC